MRKAVSQLLAIGPVPPGKKGFTLIEILVVIAIISILASLLFPVFGRARENARRSSCQSNLRQLSMGVMQYTQDFDEGFPSTLQSRPGQTPPDGIFWFSDAASTAYWAWPQMIFPYTKNMQVARCPSGKLASAAGALNGYNYGANLLLMQTTGVPSLKVSAIVAPSATYLLMDAGNYQMDPGNNVRNLNINSTNYFAYLSGVGDAVGASCTAPDNFARADCQGGRHFGGVNMAFADGHVKWGKTAPVVQEAWKFNSATHPACAWDPRGANP